VKLSVLLKGTPLKALSLKIHFPSLKENFFLFSFIKLFIIFLRCLFVSRLPSLLGGRSPLYPHLRYLFIFSASGYAKIF
jgi:hypothetical protein